MPFLSSSLVWNVLKAYAFPTDLIDDVCDVKGINSKRARARCEAYRKFVMLQILSQKSITPPPDVAVVWYLHFVQHPEDYHKLLKPLDAGTEITLYVADMNRSTRTGNLFTSDPGAEQ